MYFFIICTCLLLGSCGNPPYTGKGVLGADEFVMDSYKILEGKFSILQLKGQPYEELSEAFLEEYKDTIQKGDLLQIAVYHPTRTDISSAVQAIGTNAGYTVVEGKVRMPDLETAEIQGLTLEEARQKIEHAFTGQIKDTQAFLSYEDRIERKVELAGVVMQSTLPVDGRIRLFETFSKAKVPPNANLFKSYVIRENRMLPMDLYKLIKQGDMSQNIVKIYIAEPSASTLMVLGEVG